MWHFLARGRSGAAALAVLTRLIEDLRHLRGSLSGDASVAANAYILWVERAEVELRENFDDLDVARDLQSDRYWQIRGIHERTSRPFPLISSEIVSQLGRLQLIHDQLGHYSSRLSLKSDCWILLCDTNVYIHGRLFDQVEWQDAIGVPKVSLVMPLVVLDELDRVKDRDLAYGRRARSVLKALDRLTATGKPLEPISLRSRVTLQLLIEPRGHRRQLGQDDEIVRQAEYFAQLNDGRLVILTRDRGMRVRAQATGLDARILPQTLERIADNDSE